MTATQTRYSFQWVSHLLRWVGLILRLPRIPDGLPGVRPRIPHLLATAVLAAQDFHYLCMATCNERPRFSWESWLVTLPQSCQIKVHSPVKGPPVRLGL